MSEVCAHAWVKNPNADEGEAHQVCRKCNQDRIECWCGASGTFDELFINDGLGRTCHGTGAIDCHCGGDLCVCHNHGEVECFGCPDCEEDDDDCYAYESDDDFCAPLSEIASHP